MLEETKLVRNELDSPRRRACLNQCRLRRHYAGEEGYGCPCELAIECRFDIPDYRKGDEYGSMFPEIKKYIKEVWSE